MQCHHGAPRQAASIAAQAPVQEAAVGHHSNVLLRAGHQPLRAARCAKRVQHGGAARRTSPPALAAPPSPASSDTSPLATAAPLPVVWLLQPRRPLLPPCLHELHAAPFDFLLLLPVLQLPQHILVALYLRSQPEGWHRGKQQGGKRWVGKGQVEWASAASFGTRSGSETVICRSAGC